MAIRWASDRIQEQGIVIAFVTLMGRGLMEMPIWVFGHV